MPSRRDIFTNRSYYHIFNKTIDKKNIFNTQLMARRFLELISYYRSSKAIVRYSQFVKLKYDNKKLIEDHIYEPEHFMVDVVAYCLMPNHFHFLVKQKMVKGVQSTLMKSLNALTRYYNILINRKGPLFLTQFRSRQLLTREQYIHVSRYIHLNPYSSNLVKNKEDLIYYKYSSLGSYLTSKNDPLITRKDLLLNNFNNSTKMYQKFVFDNADYQKSLENIKHVKKWF